MPRMRRGSVDDSNAPADPAKSHHKENPLASRNVGLPQPFQPPPTVQAPPAPQDSHIPQDPPLAQQQVLHAQQTLHDQPPSHTPPTGGYGGNVGHKNFVLNNMAEIMAKDTTKKIDSVEKLTDAMYIFASIFLTFHSNKASVLIK